MSIFISKLLLIFSQESLVYSNIWNSVLTLKSGLKPQKLFNDTESVKSNPRFQTLVLYLAANVAGFTLRGTVPRDLSLRADKIFQKANGAACVRHVMCLAK